MKTNKQNGFLQMKRIICFIFTILYSEKCKPVTYLFANLLEKQKIYLKLRFSEVRFLYNR